MTLGDWSDPLDPDVETQTIYKQLLQGRDKLRSASFIWLHFIYSSVDVNVATNVFLSLLKTGDDVKKSAVCDLSE